MKNKILLWIMAVALVSWNVACDSGGKTPDESPTVSTPGAGQSAVADEESQPNIVQVAVGSADHTTLVAAVQAAELVDALANAGPFTVFAPTNAAFDKLPAGTVDNLLKRDQKATLQNVLQYHVAIGVYRQDFFQDGQVIGMASGGNTKMTVEGEDVYINGVKLLGVVPASNGLVYVIDEVLQPEK